jgi:hypothetical protein
VNALFICTHRLLVEKGIKTKAGKAEKSEAETAKLK